MLFSIKYFVDLSGKIMRLEGFQEFVRLQPRVLWDVLNLQKEIKRLNFGESYWEKKSEWFRIIRQEIGVKLHL